LYFSNFSNDAGTAALIADGNVHAIEIDLAADAQTLVMSVDGAQVFNGPLGSQAAVVLTAFDQIGNDVDAANLIAAGSVITNIVLDGPGGNLRTWALSTNADLEDSGPAGDDLSIA
jgi:hypothetical protein